MWIRLWLTLSVSTVYSQYTSTKISQDGATFGWGWRLSPTGAAEPALGHYYVKLPQSEHQMRYPAPNPHPHPHRDMLQAHSVTLGHQLQQINKQKTQNIHKSAPLNLTQMQPSPKAQPVDVYLLQQQYSPYGPTVPTMQIHSIVSTTPHYYTDSYNTATPGTLKGEVLSTTEHSKPFQGEDIDDYRSRVQIFKDHNCTDRKEHMSKDLQNDLKKSTELFAESFNFHDINNFATSYPQPYFYRGAVNFRVETPRPNARQERFYYTTVETPANENTTLDGIDKLVASTQDLISNEDLLFINHAAEKHIHEESEDIKPRTEGKKHDGYGKDNKKHITVKAKIGNIVKSEIQHYENDETKQKVLESDSNNYNFATPIVVSDNSYADFREQVVDNLVSTMVPYMVNGYKIVGVKDTLEDTHQGTQDNKLVNVTPRPVNQNYLAPITVALRLINANDTTAYNTLEDHETADSEFISDTVSSPAREKTVVEIQESIPVEITHINDVEVHEYIDFDEGRSNNKGPLDVAKSLYNKYVDAWKSKKIRDNMNKLLHQYNAVKQEHNDNDERNSSENIEPSENIHSEVQVKPNEDSNTQRSEHIQYYEAYGNDNQKIIQPIIIEKEVPVTKFVDRFIEKKVPYPQHIEVPVPVDRPYPVEVPVEKIVEKPVEVTKYVNNPYPVQVPQPYPVEIKVPYPVEKKVYVDRPVHVPYPIEKVVEKQVLQPVPVPTPVAVPIQVPYPVEHQVLYPVPVDRPVRVEVEKPVEKIVHKEIPVPYAVEKKVPYPVHYETRVPVPYPVEKRIPVPVERIVEKPVTVTKFVDRPVHIQVPVPQPVPVPVHVHHSYPVDRIVEKKVPYPVPVERIVEKPVQVPYPVEKIVEKIVEKPVIVTKYVDKPYPVEKKVPYPVEKIVEKKVPYPVEVQVPYEVKVPYPVSANIPSPYAYSHSEIISESKYNPQYEVFKDDKAKKVGDQQQLYLSQYYQLLKEKEKFKTPVQTTRWGNQYASTYQYINQSENKPYEEKRYNNNNLANYLNYVTNTRNGNQYYGPVPMQNQDDWWQSNKNYIVEVKMRRTDREPKMSNLRIEYGGFKPPLIPSMEVDLNGMPIKKQT